MRPPAAAPRKSMIKCGVRRMAQDYSRVIPIYFFSSPIDTQDSVIEGSPGLGGLQTLGAPRGPWRERRRSKWQSREEDSAELDMCLLSPCPVYMQRELCVCVAVQSVQ